jgi:hypothetical protein
MLSNHRQTFETIAGFDSSQVGDPGLLQSPDNDHTHSFAVIDDENFHGDPPLDLKYVLLLQATASDSGKKEN